MSVIIFIIILGILVFVHELGHFLIAKKSGIRVDEFGIGFPPKLWSKKRGETVYSINAIPFGGFVKIHGEDPEEDATLDKDKGRNFAYKSKWIQASVLAGGVFFNFVFAWLLISFGFMTGLPTPVSDDERVRDAQLVITMVSPDSPAGLAGIKPGDVITEMSSGENILPDIYPESISNFIEAYGKSEINILANRGERVLEFSMVPEEGIVAGRVAIGISMDMIGILRLPPHEALIQGGVSTYNLTILISKGLGSFIKDAFTGNGALSQITGPVGIVGIVGDVTELGLAHLIAFTAFISINLAIINLMPFPALDGGRLLFVLIEAIKGTPIKPKIANTLNAIGFMLLILLMIVVTVNDILKLF